MKGWLDSSESEKPGVLLASAICSLRGSEREASPLSLGVPTCKNGVSTQAKRGRTSLSRPPALKDGVAGGLLPPPAHSAPPSAPQLRARRWPKRSTRPSRESSSTQVGRQPGAASGPAPSPPATADSGHTPPPSGAQPHPLLLAPPAQVTPLSCFHPLARFLAALLSPPKPDPQSGPVP